MSKIYPEIKTHLEELQGSIEKMVTQVAQPAPEKLKLDILAEIANTPQLEIDEKAKTLEAPNDRHRHPRRPPGGEEAAAPRRGRTQPRLLGGRRVRRPGAHRPDARPGDLHPPRRVPLPLRHHGRPLRLPHALELGELHRSAGERHVLGPGRQLHDRRRRDGTDGRVGENLGKAGGARLHHDQHDADEHHEPAECRHEERLQGKNYPY